MSKRKNNFSHPIFLAVKSRRPLTPQFGFRITKPPSACIASGPSSPYSLGAITAGSAARWCAPLVRISASCCRPRAPNRCASVWLATMYWAEIRPCLVNRWLEILPLLVSYLFRTTGRHSYFVRDQRGVRGMTLKSRHFESGWNVTFLSSLSHPQYLLFSRATKKFIQIDRAVFLWKRTKTGLWA
jgi:hypothetical protein